MSTNSNCSAGCPTQDHSTYGECIRAKSMHVAYCNSAGRYGDATVQRKWDAELDAYRSAVKQGMQPETTKLKDTMAAVKWSEKHGQAYSAEAAQSVRFEKALEKQ